MNWYPTSVENLENYGITILTHVETSPIDGVLIRTTVITRTFGVSVQTDTSVSTVHVPGKHHLMRGTNFANDGLWELVRGMGNGE